MVAAAPSRFTRTRSLGLLETLSWSIVHASRGSRADRKISSCRTSGQQDIPIVLRSMAMFKLSDRFAITGIGETAYTKNSGTSVLNLAVEACSRAAVDAGIPVEEVDGIISYNFNNDSAPAIG